MNSNESLTSLGFLTVVEHAEHGLFGGYLLLNAAGRPLEFHCTAPIKPNRAQEILYGPTLSAFLFGEQIGQTLLAQSKQPPAVVCTDRLQAMAVRDFVAMPVALVLLPEETDAGGPTKHYRVDGPHTAAPKLDTILVSGQRLAVCERHAADRALVAERLREYAECLDLFEPFGRIRAAIEEAQRSARA